MVEKRFHKYALYCGLVRDSRSLCSHNSLTMIFIRYIVAILLSVYNKWMFSPDRYGFSWPLFVTMLHMFVQFAFAAAVRNLWPSRFRPAYNPGRKDYASVEHQFQ